MTLYFMLDRVEWFIVLRHAKADITKLGVTVFIQLNPGYTPVKGFDSILLRISMRIKNNLVGVELQSEQSVSFHSTPFPPQRVQFLRTSGASSAH